MTISVRNGAGLRLFSRDIPCARKAASRPANPNSRLPNRSAARRTLSRAAGRARQAREAANLAAAGAASGPRRERFGDKLGERWAAEPAGGATDVA